MFKYLKIATASVLLSNLAMSHEVGDTAKIESPSQSTQTNEFEKSTHAAGKKYTCIFDSETHNNSKNWLRQHSGYTGHYKVKFKHAPTLPAVIDLRSMCPAIYDQGDLGSCTANAINGAMQFIMMKEKLPSTPMLSRLFTYYEERALEDSITEDAGASISDGLRVVSTTGVCQETLWPYNISQFAVKPTANCYTDAKLHVDLDNLRTASLNQDLTTLKTVLASSTPFVFGFSVYSSFETAAVARTGVVPMPNLGKHSKDKLLGGHAIMACGYNDSMKAFLCRNSWGTDWGLGGYFWLPYAYVTSDKLASDFWKISGVGAKH